MPIARPNTRALIASAAVTVAVVAAFVSAAWFLRGSGADVLTDGAALVTPAEQADPRSVLWNTPEPLPPTINTPAPETSANSPSHSPSSSPASRASPRPP